LKAITFDDCVEGKGSDTIYQKFGEVVKSLEETNRMNQHFSGLADHVLDLFGNSRFAKPFRSHF
jgi:hypothetical protein